MENSRLTYRELAGITNISVSAIYKHIKNLLQSKSEQKRCYYTIK